MKKVSFSFLFFWSLLLLPLLTVGQRNAALVSFTLKGLPEQVRQQMTQQALDSLHSTLVRQLVQAHRLSSMTPLQPEKVRFAGKGRAAVSRKISPRKLSDNPDFDLYYEVIAEFQTETVFAGLKLPTVKVRMAAFDRLGKRLLLTESLGKDGITHAKRPAADAQEDLLDQDRFKKMYLRAVSSLRSGGLSRL